MDRHRLLAATLLGTLVYLGTRIDGLEARIDALGARLDSRIDALGDRLYFLIAGLEGRLTSRIGALDAKLDDHLRRHAS